jgi:hypothetical protein
MICLMDEKGEGVKKQEHDDCVNNNYYFQYFKNPYSCLSDNLSCVSFS